MPSASRRWLIALSTAPASGMPKWASSMAGVLGASTDTVSPGAMPRIASADARRWQRSRVCAQVRVSSPCTTATRFGCASAARSRKPSGVSGT
ncbi:hypothetical protein D9M69_621550 [compost metagenome]